MNKIALIYSGLNFEKQKESVMELHKEFKKRGDCLYLLTAYEPLGDSEYPMGDEAVYSLASKSDFSGFVFDGTVNGNFISKYFFESGRIGMKPVVMLNAESELAPSVQQDSYGVASEMLEHLINEHGCKKINFVADMEWLNARFFSAGGLQAYKDIMWKYRIPYEEKRVVDCKDGVPEGEALSAVFKARNIDDCDAVFFYRDLNAIGYIKSLVSEGKKVPEDVKVISMDRSVNSIAFKPDISGAVREEGAEALAIAELLYEQMNGKMIRPVKSYKAQGAYGCSCGCVSTLKKTDEAKMQDIVFSKIGVASQISTMMRFNDTLEKVASLEEYSELVKNMFKGLGCKDFAVCLNERDIAYILDASEDVATDLMNPLDERLYILTGEQNGKDLTGMEIDINDISPLEVQAGDLVTVMPIVHGNKAFGYFVMLNEYLPITQYNFRICYESLGSSIESLHQHMVLKHSINKLNEMRIRDPLTGLYNREYITSFKASLNKLSEYTIVMMDMDGLKKINDQFGHEEGNRAIKILADAINHASCGGDIISRYGGDEFVVMAPADTSEYWEAQKEKINNEIKQRMLDENLPYTAGVSIGYAVHNAEHPYKISECFEKADENMYKNKVARKACRTD